MFLRSNTTGFPDNGGGPLYSLTRETQNRKARQFTSAIEYAQPILSSWRIRGHVGQFDARQELRIPAILDDLPPGPFARPSISGDSDVSRLDAYASSEWQILADFIGILGGGVRRETGRGSNLIAEVVPTDFSLTRSTPFVTGELQYSRGAFGASFATRTDFPSGSRRYSPDFGFTYRSPSGRFRARVGLRHAFKLPSFFALADPSVGNPDLIPEKNRAIDGGIGVFLGEGKPSVSVSVFGNRFRDLIDFSPQVFKLVNRSIAHANGAEVEVTVPLRDTLQIRVHATFVRSRIEGTNEPLRDRPRWRTGLGVIWKPIQRLEFRHHTRWVSSRADFQIPIPQPKAPAYWNTDVITEYTVSKVSLFVRLDNAGNSRYEEFIGFPKPGFAIAAGLSTRITR
jgi:outer membrane cobalamin receptor